MIKRNKFIKVLCIFLLSLVTLSSTYIYNVAAAANPVELFNDVLFSHGFRAQNNFGTKYSPDNNLKKGDTLEYRDIAPHKIYLIPDGDVTKVSDKNRYWEFEEGEHRNYTDQFGKSVKELFEHRLCVNHVVEKNTDNSLIVSQYNNYGIDQKNSNYNQKLVRQVSSNKHGRIKMYYNSQNEIHNTAYAMSAEFAHDTWPTFLLAQTFKKNIDLGKFNKVNVTMDVKLLKSLQLSKWPNDAKIDGAKSPSGASLLSYFLLRKKGTLNPLWVGLALYSTTGAEYVPIYTQDQWGIGFYRNSSKKYGGILKLGEQKTIKFDLKQLASEALKRASNNPGPLQGTKIDDMEIDGFNIGWENIGHWETEYEISNLSAKAYLK